MTASTPEPSTSGAPAPSGQPERPPNLGFMVGWMVFLGIYQITLAWRFGTFFEGEKGDLRQYYGGAALASGFHVGGLRSACNARKCLSVAGFLACRRSRSTAQRGTP